MSAALAYPPYEQPQPQAAILHMPEVRLCAACRLPIPAKRLLVMPNAKLCVPCLTAKGDIPVIRRFDESSNGEQVGTYFMNNEQQMRRAVIRQCEMTGRFRGNHPGMEPLDRPEYSRTFTAVSLGRAVYEQGVEEHRELSEARRKK